MANFVYVNPSIASVVTFTASGGNVNLTMDDIATASGRVGDIWDRGTGAQPAEYTFQMTSKLKTAGTLGLTATLFYASSHDSVCFDGALVSGNAALSAADLRRNLRTLIVISADQTTSNVSMTGSQRVFLTERYIIPVFYNEFGVNTHATANGNVVTAIPIPTQIQ